MKNIILVLAIVFVFTVVSVKPALATFNFNWCDFVSSPACGVTPSVEPSVAPTVEPTIEVSEVPSVTQEVTVTPEVTATPTVAPSSNGDGRSDGLSSCPDCTKAHPMPAGPPATGRGN